MVGERGTVVLLLTEAVCIRKHDCGAHLRIWGGGGGGGNRVRDSQRHTET